MSKAKEKHWIKLTLFGLAGIGLSIAVCVFYFRDSGISDGVKKEDDDSNDPQPQNDDIIDSLLKQFDFLTPKQLLIVESLVKPYEPEIEILLSGGEKKLENLMKLIPSASSVRPFQTEKMQKFEEIVFDFIEKTYCVKMPSENDDNVIKNLRNLDENSGLLALIKNLPAVIKKSFNTNDIKEAYKLIENMFSGKFDQGEILESLKDLSSDICYIFEFMRQFIEILNNSNLKQWNQLILGVNRKQDTWINILLSIAKDLDVMKTLGTIIKSMFDMITKNTPNLKSTKRIDNYVDLFNVYHSELN